MTTPAYETPLGECTVTIVGLGLMGGSLGLALRGLVGRVVGVDRQEVLEQAMAVGAIDQDAQDLRAGVAGAHLIVLATPVSVILTQIEAIGRLAETGGLLEGVVLTDLGSTKEQVCRQMQALPDPIQPVGGHPMCGKERSGLAAAEARLFQGTPFILCPLERSAPRAVSLVEGLVQATGAYPLHLTPARHDRLAATISHLPYVAAIALFHQASQMAREDLALWQLAASGFRSTTRLAGSDDKMMADILLSNGPAVLSHITALQDRLSQIAGLVAQQDEAGLRKCLRQARNQRIRFLKEHGP